MEDDILEKQSMKIQFHTHSDFSQGDKQEGRGILFHRFPVKCFEMILFSSQFLVRTGELTSENLEIQQPGMVVLDHWSTIDRVSIGEKYSYALVVRMDRNQDVCFILCSTESVHA